MKRLVYTAVAALAFTVTAVFFHALWRGDQPAPQQQTDMLIGQIRTCARLNTVKYKVSIAQLMDDITWYTPGERKIVVPISFTAVGSVDFSDFGTESIFINADGSVKIFLPPVSMTLAAEVDYSKVRENKSWYRWSFTPKEISLLKQEARKKCIERIAPRIKADTEREAHLILSTIVKKAMPNVTDITVSFSDNRVHVKN